jgi:hypothetical protein
MWQWLADLLTWRTRAQRAGGEPDVESDPAQPGTGPTGGVSDPDAADAHSTTGPSENETFVGRVAGEDAGDAGITGAEARSSTPGDARGG